jgi:chromosome segregation ATPase
MEKAETMSELIARLERAFFALTRPMPVALPAPDRQSEVDALRVELGTMKVDRDQALAQQTGAERALELTRRALASANEDTEALGVTCADLRNRLDALTLERDEAIAQRDEARRAVGDRDEQLEALRASPAQSAGPTLEQVDAAAGAAQKAVGGSLEYVAPERLVEYARNVFARLFPHVVEGTENADGNV